MRPEHSTIVSSWMLKSNASAVVVAEKMWISQNMLWLPCSNCMSRWQCKKQEEKTTTFLSAGHKYGLRFVKKLCTHIQVLGIVAMGRTSSKGAMRAIVGSKLYSSLLNSKSPLIRIVGKQRKDHMPRSLNYCCFANEWVLFFAMPFLAHKDFVLMGRLKTAKCECLWSSAHCQVRLFVKQG